MQAINDPLGQKANLLAQTRLQYFRGYAIIDMRHLSFESDAILGSRPLDQTNVRRLHTMFALEGCANLEPEHKVAATVSELTLQEGLTRTGITQEALFNQVNPVNLSFEDSVRLVCVFGKHRLRAGEGFGVDRWLVELYSTEIPLDALAQLREESSGAQAFKDGEIYTILRRYQLSNNDSQEQKWWARFQSDDRRKNFRRLQRNKFLREGFDKLLPYCGLWEPLKAYHIERILGLRCHEYIRHYLEEIYQAWSFLFSKETAYMADPTSVRLIEGLMFSYSLDDCDRLQGLMISGTVFPHVKGDERINLQRKLLQIPGRLLSINTLIQDTLYLQSPAKAFRSLLPKRFKGTLREAMRQNWSSQNNKQLGNFQASEHEFRTLPSPADSFLIGIMQLWLFALRHLVQPRRDNKHPQIPASRSSEAHNLSNMAILAHQLGFTSAEINTLRLRDTTQWESKSMLRAFCVDGFYQIDEAKINSMANRMKDYWRILQRKQNAAEITPSLVTNEVELMTRRRYNCPFQSEDDRDRNFLFLEHIYSAEQPRARYATSFAVTREILYAFFGKSPLYDIFSQGSDNTSHVVSPTMEWGTIPSKDDPLVEAEAASYGPSPVELEPHPPGTPDRSTEGFETRVPLAAGFEDDSCKAPLETKAMISLHRNVAEILQMWYETGDSHLVVLFLFESRTYYKFDRKSENSLRLRLTELGKEHYFLVIGDYGVELPNLSTITEVAMRERLILVGYKDGPSKGVTDGNGQISLDSLKDYVTKFDVRTGKRKAGDSYGGHAKRRAQ
ncbi:hypothetical protein BO82DRAFT_285995 [Aspergillus uvarum CBS 121591]|uniref:Uncharacterized protein n=2 Tax=Aspergillus TaxID=5052 RepID=A0A319CY58_9EURO|nr:hypothetical protein BO82DRAFT_285995 [Aspergillus uvarum CBS 121591]PYH80578.1 hypothetical protein BO82DRAFT_285995 [Aspergillus uvarum CBS 121591]PYI13431.1 hypothetical protein BO99DRAFT_347417 [Aspergillus violaceofuscus CBS 115571]